MNVIILRTGFENNNNNKLDTDGGWRRISRSAKASYGPHLLTAWSRLLRAEPSRALQSSLISLERKDYVRGRNVLSSLFSIQSSLSSLYGPGGVRGGGGSTDP